MPCPKNQIYCFNQMRFINSMSVIDIKINYLLPEQRAQSQLISNKNTTKYIITVQLVRISYINIFVPLNVHSVFSFVIFHIVFVLFVFTFHSIHLFNVFCLLFPLERNKKIYNQKFGDFFSTKFNTNTKR